MRAGSSATRHVSFSPSADALPQDGDSGINVEPKAPFRCALVRTTSGGTASSNEGPPSVVKRTLERPRRGAEHRPYLAGRGLQTDSRLAALLTCSHLLVCKTKSGLDFGIERCFLKFPRILYLVLPIKYV
jgi:hypothetical protein